MPDKSEIFLFLTYSNGETISESGEFLQIHAARAFSSDYNMFC